MMNEMKNKMIKMAQNSQYANKEVLLQEIECIFYISKNASDVIQNIENSTVFGEELFNMEKVYKFYTEFKKIFLSAVLPLAFK